MIMDLSIFDLDKTITKRATSFTLAIGLVRRRVIPLTFFFKFIHKYLYNLFLNREMKKSDLNNIIEDSLSFLKGKDRAFFEKVVREVIEPKFDKLIYKKSLKLIEGERKKGRMLVLATAAPKELAEIFKDRLGFDFLLSTELEMVENKYSGLLSQGFCHGKGKEKRVETLIKEKGFKSIYIFSDSINDLPLFSLYRKGLGVNPDKKLRRWLKENGLEYKFMSKFARIRNYYLQSLLLLTTYYMAKFSL